MFTCPDKSKPRPPVNINTTRKIVSATLPIEIASILSERYQPHGLYEPSISQALFAKLALKHS